jgi:photosystem II stability/assembly factor-like uncharacterized protein
MKFHMFRQLSRIALARTALACACATMYAATLAEAPATPPAPPASAQPASGQPTSAQPSSGWIDPINAPAEVLPLASRSLLLDVARSGERYVAVGARGNILLSDDGRAWRQSAVPTRTTFTAVATIDAQIWAVGHDGVIAHSADGGEHWELQRQDPWKAPAAGDTAVPDPHQGAPLLGVLFLDIHRGYAVGAYSLALKTSDGGATWQPLTVAKGQTNADAGDELGPAEKNSAGKNAGKSDHGDKLTFSKDELKLGQEATPHFNAIARTGSGALLIVGERGSAFRSRDEGATWQRQQLPYDGSMFGVIGYEADHVLAFGLRGHVYESTDLGEHWTQVATGTELSLMGGAASPDGATAIVGANGIVLMRAKAGEPLKSYVDESAGIIASVLPLANGGGLLIAGENGVSLFQPQ